MIRTKDGFRCAVGLLIPDEMYQGIRMELCNVETLLEICPQLVAHFGECDTEFLGGLQDIHDTYCPVYNGTPFSKWMREGLTNFAKEYCLSIPE